MRSTYKKLGDYIRLVDERNTEMVTDNVFGINIDKYFMPSVANIIGTDLRKYKLLRKGRFACNPMHVGRDERLPVACYNEDAPAIVSSAYFMFELKKNVELDPDYLMLYFRKPDFDRLCWFRTDASVRGGISWDDFCSMPISIPPLAEQRKIVHDYQVITDRIELLGKSIKNIDKNNEIQLSTLFSEASNSREQEILRIGDHATIYRGVSYAPEETVDKPTNGYIPIFRANNIVDGSLTYDELVYVLDKNVKPEQIVKDRSLIIAMSSGSQAHVGKVAMAYDNIKYSYGAFCAMIVIEKAYEGVISTFLKGPWFTSYLKQALLGTTISNIRRKDIECLEFIVPSHSQLSIFENQYQVTAAYKASIVKEIVTLKDMQKLLINSLAKGA